MLFLSERDMKQAISMNETIDAIDSAYRVYEGKKFQMPTRMQVADKENTLIVMPCITTNAIGTKLVTSFPKNKESPTLHGLVILNSSETGEIKAILDGSFLTGFRTGAIGGSAIRHLSKQNVKKIAVIGTGVQGLFQAIAACSTRNITDIYLHNRSPRKMKAFTKMFKTWIHTPIKLHEAQTVEKAIENAEVIITATTSSTPVLPDNPSLLQNKLIIGIGSFQPTMREFPRSLYDITDHIFVDSNDAILESGDLKVPLDYNWTSENKIQTMSSFLQNCRAIKQEQNKSIIFKSTGMALFDVVVANVIYQNALQKGVGTLLS